MGVDTEPELYCTVLYTALRVGPGTGTGPYCPIHKCVPSIVLYLYPLLQVLCAVLYSTCSLWVIIES